MVRALGGLLYGVQPADPFTFALVPLLLGGVAILAILPARRVSLLNPPAALHTE